MAVARRCNAFSITRTGKDLQARIRCTAIQARATPPNRNDWAEIATDASLPVELSVLAALRAPSVRPRRRRVRRRLAVAEAGDVFRQLDAAHVLQYLHHRRQAAGEVLQEAGRGALAVGAVFPDDNLVELDVGDCLGGGLGEGVEVFEHEDLEGGLGAAARFDDPLQAFAF